MSEDGWLIAIVGAVWIALAAIYALVPAFHMPGSALVWGVGGAGFMVLSLLIAWAEKQNAGTTSSHSNQRSGNS